MGAAFWDVSTHTITPEGSDDPSQLRSSTSLINSRRCDDDQRIPEDERAQLNPAGRASAAVKVFAQRPD